jgi:hypothetical protein
MRKILLSCSFVLSNCAYYPIKFEGYIDQGEGVHRWKITGKGCILQMHVSKTAFKDNKLTFGISIANIIKDIDVDPCLPTTAVTVDDSSNNITGEIIPENGLLGCRLNGSAFAIYTGPPQPVDHLNEACRLIAQKRDAVAKKFGDYEKEYLYCTRTRGPRTCLIRALGKAVSVSNDSCKLEVYLDEGESAAQEPKGIDPCVVSDGEKRTKEYWETKLGKAFTITGVLVDDRSLVCFVDGLKYARYTVVGAKKEMNHESSFCRAVIDKYIELTTKSGGGGIEEFKPTKLDKIMRYSVPACQLDLFVDKEYKSDKSIFPCVYIGDQSSTKAYWEKELGRYPKITAFKNKSDALDCFVDGVRYAQYTTAAGGPDWYSFLKEKHWTKFCREIIGKYLQMIKKTSIPLKIHAFKPLRKFGWRERLQRASSTK